MASNPTQKSYLEVFDGHLILEMNEDQEIKFYTEKVSKKKHFGLSQSRMELAVLCIPTNTEHSERFCDTGLL